jgi:hypothetical protein
VRWIIYKMECPLNKKLLSLPNWRNYQLPIEWGGIYTLFKFIFPCSLWNVEKWYIWPYLQIKNWYTVASFAMFAPYPGQIKRDNSASMGSHHYLQTLHNHWFNWRDEHSCLAMYWTLTPFCSSAIMSLWYAKEHYFTLIQRSDVHCVSLLLTPDTSFKYF